MAIKIRRLGILIALTMVLLLGAVLIALSYTSVGITDSVEAGEVPLALPDFSKVPESVAQDATELAISLYGDYQVKYEGFVNQLLATYVEAEDKDIVVIFNPGGWGWNLVDESPGWRSIFDGINSELVDLGYSSLLLDYRRTEDTFRGIIDEFVEIIAAYPSKADELAYRVDFLTSHIPEVKVIIAGESVGTIISDRTMSLLRDNSRVYSIQTGRPFWHKGLMAERTLLLNDNGVNPDSLSSGDIISMLRASLKAAFGLSSLEDEAPGKIFHFVRAPGHDYNWEYPTVCAQITSFLKSNLGFKQN
ncbi:hypothetical protein ACFLXG_02990 [Chloroflexota bacterium]